MTQRKPGQPNKLWLAFVEDGFEMVIALAFGIFGLSSFIFTDLLTPPSVDASASLSLVIIWHLSMAGGLAAAVGRVMLWERAEMSGLASLAFSCLFYLTVAIFVVGSASAGLALLLICVLVGCVIRMWVLRKSLKAQEMVHHIVEELRHNGTGGDAS